jgi:hypothetical protein
VGHIASGGKSEMYTQLLAGNLQEMSHFKDLSVHGRILLNRIFEKYGWSFQLDHGPLDICIR